MPTTEAGLKPSELAAFAGDGEVRAAADDAAFAAGSAATHPHAVHYQGAWETPWDGTCVAVRLHARALAATGIPVLLESFHRVQINQQGFAEPAHGNLADSVIDEVGHLVNTSAASLVPRIKHLVVRDAEHLRSCIVPRFLGPDTVNNPTQLVELRDAIYGTTIAFTVWERDRIDRPVARQLSRCAQAWVPCVHNRHMLIENGVPQEQVFVVPHPFDPNADICKLVRRTARIDRRFYSISGAWQPRKGYHLLLGAFLRAFRPSDAVHLTIKYNPSQWQDYASPVDCLKRWLDDSEVRANGWTMQTLNGKLEMISGRLSPNNLLKLHFDNNIYVCSSHGEAWCLPAFDAKCAGNRLVHIPWGGTADFADPEDVSVPYRLEPAHPSYKWGEDARWADYNVDDLAIALRKVRPPTCYGRTVRFQERFSLEAVGERMRNLVISVASRVPQARKYLEQCQTQ